MREAKIAFVKENIALRDGQPVWITSGGRGKGKWEAGTPVSFSISTCPNGYKRWRLTRKGLCIYKSWVVYIAAYGELPDTVDHKNGDTLDDSLANLRPATKAQQSQNRKYTSTVQGVTRRKGCKTNPWMARITIDGKRKVVGYFPTVEEAASAYWEAANEHYGEFARGAA